MVPDGRAAARRAARRDFALAAESGHRDRGPAFLLSPGHRPARPRTRACATTSGREKHVEGGSTITQQLARTLYLSNRAQRRPQGQGGGHRAACSRRGCSKSQILELYLNRVYLSAGIYGVEAMSTSVFGKHASDLTIGEAALIAGLIKAPSALSPWTNLDGARRRSELVLARMQAAGYITGTRGRRCAARTPAHPAASGAEPPRARLREGISAPAVPRATSAATSPPDWQVQTTVLPAVQDMAEQSVADGLRVWAVRTAGRARRPRSRHGRRPGHRRRQRFRDVHVQPRVAQPSPAGIGVQALRVCAALERGMSPVTMLDGPGGDGATG